MTRPFTRLRLVFRSLALVAVALGGMGAATAAHALGVRQTLVATGADPDASGKAQLHIKHKKGALRGQLVVLAKRTGRSRVSVNGQNLTAGAYHARIRSGANTAASGPAPTAGGQVELDFDSDPGDIAQGATPIGTDFIQGTPLAVMGDLLDGADAVVTSATVTCVVR